MSRSYPSKQFRRWRPAHCTHGSACPQKGCRWYLRNGPKGRCASRFCREKSFKFSLSFSTSKSTTWPHPSIRPRPTYHCSAAKEGPKLIKQHLHCCPNTTSPPIRHLSFRTDCRLHYLIHSKSQVSQLLLCSLH